jgi:hypothetical protein
MPYIRIAPKNGNATVGLVLLGLVLLAAAALVAAGLGTLVVRLIGGACT